MAVLQCRMLTHGCASFYVPQRLVHPSQPEGCVFSHTSICLPISGVGGGTFDVPITFPLGETFTLQNMPRATGTFGFSYSCHSRRPPNCEGVSTMACIPRCGPLTPSALLCQGLSGIYDGASSVKNPWIFDSGGLQLRPLQARKVVMTDTVVLM